VKSNHARPAIEEKGPSCPGSIVRNYVRAWMKGYKSAGPMVRLREFSALLRTGRNQRRKRGPAAAPRGSLSFEPQPILAATDAEAAIGAVLAAVAAK
jgi:hypothetical protein